MINNIVIIIGIIIFMIICMVALRCSSRNVEYSFGNSMDSGVASAGAGTGMPSAGSRRLGFVLLHLPLRLIQ